MKKVAEAARIQECVCVSVFLFVVVCGDINLIFVVPCLHRYEVAPRSDSEDSGSEEDEVQ